MRGSVQKTNKPFGVQLSIAPPRNRAANRAATENVMQIHFQDSECKHRYSLHYGNAQHPLARIVPDNCWPSMWRIVWPDGQMSDMLNLSRAKDAAAAIAERGPPARDQRRFHWKITPLENAPTASPVAPTLAATPLTIKGVRSPGWQPVPSQVAR